MLGDGTSRQAEGTQTWYQCVLGSLKMSKYECEIVRTSLLPHVKLEAPGVLWCFIICCGFKSFSVPSKAEAEQLSSKGLDLKSSFILTTVLTMLLIFPGISMQSVV